MEQLPITKEVWQGRVFAESPDEAAEIIRRGCGCEDGKLVIREIWAAPGGWYEYRVEYNREG